MLEIRRGVHHTVQGILQNSGSLRHIGQRLLPVMGINVLWLRLAPAQFGIGGLLAHHQAPIAYGFFKDCGDHLPVHQAAGQLQTGGQRVACEVQQLAGAELFA